MLGPVLETLIGGLMTGVLYSLVALGFVLIFKASGVFNFAQGAMVLFAALSFARLSEFMPLVVAFAFSVLIMIALAYAIEFLVLRHLVNQEGIIRSWPRSGSLTFSKASDRPSGAATSTRSGWGCRRIRSSFWSRSFPAGC